MRIRIAGIVICLNSTAVSAGSVAAEFMSFVVEDERIFKRLKSSPKRVGGLDVPIPYSPPMEQYALPSRESIKTAVKRVMT